MRVLSRTHYYLVPGQGVDSAGSVAKLEFQIFDEAPFKVDGLKITPLPVEHGKGFTTSGFRFGDVCYVPDTSLIPDETARLIVGCDLLILDALRPGSDARFTPDRRTSHRRSKATQTAKSGVYRHGPRRRSRPGQPAVALAEGVGWSRHRACLRRHVIRNRDVNDSRSKFKPSRDRARFEVRGRIASTAPVGPYSSGAICSSGEPVRVKAGSGHAKPRRQRTGPRYRNSQVCT